MKKILIMSPVGGASNGADIATNNQMAYLKSLGYDIFLITNVPNTTSYQEFLDENSIKSFLIDYTWWTDESLNSKEDGVRNSRAIARIIEIINEQKIDIAVTVTANIPQLAWASSLANIPHLWLIHEFPEGQFKYTESRYDFISNFSNEILGASDILAETIRNIPSVGTQVSYFYPYTNIENIKLIDENISPRIVSVNSINGEGKNTLELLKIFKELKKSYPQLKLVITGKVFDKEYFKMLLKYIEENNIMDIEFSDDYNSNWSNVSVNDIFVNTSLNETFSLTISEAIKLGVVTVLSDKSSEAYVKLGYFDSNDIYTLSNIEEAVTKISSKLDNFLNSKMAAQEKQREFSVNLNQDKINSNLVTALEKYSINPRSELKHFEKQFPFVSETLDERMTAINEQSLLLGERMDIIDELRERITELEETKLQYDELKRRKLYKFLIK